MHTITNVETYTKTLGVEWNVNSDHFRLTITDLPVTNVTKQLLISYVAKTFDVLGWFSPAIIKVKIWLWELKLDLDDPVPQHVKEAWLQWKSERTCLSKKHISRCYFTELVRDSIHLHGFFGASEDAYRTWFSSNLLITMEMFTCLANKGCTYQTSVYSLSRTLWYLTVVSALRPLEWTGNGLAPSFSIGCLATHGISKHMSVTE